MQGLMMNRPLSIIDILTYAAEAHPAEGIVSARTEGDIHRETYPEALARVSQLAHALAALGIGEGDRVATLAWNGYRHFELYYAISGIGAVCHTINPRLAAEQMIYIVNHAEDRVLFTDITFVPILEALRPHLPEALRIVVMTDRAHMPDSPLDLLCYEELLDGQPTDYPWPELDENTASALCYTSGTTGNPKGALYSHRSTVLHSFTVAVSLLQKLGLGKRILPVVPLFHVNAWGLPYMAPMTGATLVMPGAHLDGKSLYDLIEAERVEFAWGVPSVWMGLMAEIKARGRNPEALTDMLVGGAAPPRSMIAAFEERGICVNHAWGMTEMSPIGTHGTQPPAVEALPLEQKLDIKQRAGRRAFGVELKITDPEGTRMPHDGEATGELFVRGNTIASAYFNDAAASAKSFDAEGWFATGDVASISPEGYLTIRDRTKDLIKSGGEWISSIDLENAVVSHPAVAACAAVAVPHPKWGERPVLIAVASGEARPTLDEICDHVKEHFAKWQMPDDVVWVDALPMTATGKISKLTLRGTLGDYVHPDLR